MDYASQEVRADFGCAENIPLSFPGTVVPMYRGMILRVSMTTFAELTADIDSCDYLFLRDLKDDGSNSLRLLIEEASPRPEVESLVVSGAELKGARRVESSGQSGLFEIMWASYVAYS